MLQNFPSDYMTAMDWQWSDWHPFFQQLADTTLDSTNVSEWLSDYDLLGRLYNEVEGHILVDARVDTTDEVVDKRKKLFKETVAPETEAYIFKLDKKLIESGLTPPELKIPLRTVEAQIRLYRDENRPLKIRISELDSEYDRIAGAQTVEWDGEEITVSRLRPFIQDASRDIREKAWSLMHNCWRQDRDKHNELWRDFMQVRKQMYQNADLNNYREYAWLDRARYDYTPQDVEQFLDSIKQVVVPATGRQMEKLRQRLGYDTLRPWDTSVDPLKRDPLRPFETMDEFIGTTSAIFHQVDPMLGEQFDIMKNNDLLDLENRKGKSQGGFCMTYQFTRRPYIFMNAVGTDNDVRTLLHESGHAFHGFSKLKLEYALQLRSPSEFNEVAAMAMELIPLPYITREHGGFFTDQEAARYQLSKLRGILALWSYMAVVVAFQHWIYTHHDEATDPDACDEKWWEYHAIFNQAGINWEGYEDNIINIWRRQLHIFHWPFYYVEYGLAQLGAVQIWANALQNQQTALEQYRDALALGGTATLPELYEAAGVKLAFDVETLGNAVELIETRIEEMEALDG